MNRIRKIVARFLRRSANIVSPDTFTDYSWPFIIAIWVVFLFSIYVAGVATN